LIASRDAGACPAAADVADLVEAGGGDLAAGGPGLADLGDRGHDLAGPAVAALDWTVLVPPQDGWPAQITPSHAVQVAMYCAATHWRVDLIMTSLGTSDKCVRAYVERAASHAERWSDHAPVTAVFDLG
jgi:hypothetical protein